MTNVLVVIGGGRIDQAIARRVGVGKHVLLADMRPHNASAAAAVMGNAGYEVSVATVDVSSREAVHALVERAMSRGDVRSSGKPAEREHCDRKREELDVVTRRQDAGAHRIEANVTMTGRA